MRIVQITMDIRREEERERGGETLGTQVLILPIVERRSFDVNRTHI